ncbi:MAG: glycoside hydrolase family 3 N-terminal domain-containing protein [Spirochaetia bacterium]|jgi:beta-glucosidase-like glycosyl hydrolase
MRAISFILILFAIAAAWCPAQSTFVDSLAKKGEVEIPIAQAKMLESELGQLFIINVDGFGYSGPLALEPGYAELVQRLQIGGVIPHYGSTSYEKIRRTNQTLSGLTRLPLLICCDIVKLKGPSGLGSFGDGYVGGFLGKFRRMQDAELSTLAALNAFAFAAIGINVALGPTVDTSTGETRTPDRARLVMDQMKSFGLEPVLKHFPFLPTTANLHHASPDMKLELSEAEKRFAIFQELAPEAGIMMTTHLYDSNVDQGLVTFSPAWNSLLRDRTGFNGLLMSDGLLMLKNYADRSVLAGGPAGQDVEGLDEAAVWALRAILAGHDLIIVEGSAPQTSRVFEGLLTAACRGTPLGGKLRERIDESSARIARWKQDREQTLRRVVDVSAAAMDAVIGMLPDEDASLPEFRFDPAGLARLEPELRAAMVTR